MMEILLFVMGLFIGALSVYFWFTNKANPANDQRYNALQTQLDSERSKRIEAETRLKVVDEELRKQHEQMKNTFESLAARSLSANNEAFVQFAKQTFEKYFVKAEADLQNNKTQLSGMLEPLHKALASQEAMVRSFQQETGKTFGSLKMYLEVLGTQQKSLERETSSLVTALKAPKVRGRWGEIGLRRLVEFSGLNEYCDFSEQVNVNTNNGRLRPDMIVSMPGNKQIVVDSKLPLNAYLEAIETDNEQEKRQLAEQHTRAVETHLRQLSSKEYWSQFSQSVDFVVMYIEVEPAFGMALMQNKNLISEAIRNRVVFATPTTLITMLQTISYSWKQHQATENALEIWRSSKELYKRLTVFTDHLQRVGTQIDGLAKTYNQAVGSWENRVMPGIKRLEDLGVRTEQQQKTELVGSEAVVRDLKKTTEG